MKTFILSLFLLAFSCSSFAQGKLTNSHTEQNAVVWAQEFSDLVKKREWEKARFIAPIGQKYFSKTQVWSSSSFKAIWHTWLQGDAYSSWKESFDRNAMWRSALNEERETFSMGVRHEHNGMWYILFAQKTDTATWKCPKTCPVTIQIDNQRYLFALQSPQSNQSGSQTLGFSMPWTLLKNTPQQWTVIFPDKTQATFDTSFVPLVCSYKIKGCQQMYQQAINQNTSAVQIQQ